jgi:hypothetical protein
VSEKVIIPSSCYRTHVGFFCGVWICVCVVGVYQLNQLINQKGLLSSSFIELQQHELSMRTKRQRKQMAMTTVRALGLPLHYATQHLGHRKVVHQLMNEQWS